jgi:hypothetical protein
LPKAPSSNQQQVFLKKKIKIKCSMKFPKNRNSLITQLTLIEHSSRMCGKTKWKPILFLACGANQSKFDWLIFKKIGEAFSEGDFLLAVFLG